MGSKLDEINAAKLIKDPTERMEKIAAIIKKYEKKRNGAKGNKSS